MVRASILLLILISSCDQKSKMPANKIADKTKEEFKLEKADYAILKYSSEYHWIFKDAQPTELTQAELITTEKILKDAIEKNNEVQKKNLKKHNEEHPEYQLTETGYELDLPQFQRQYLPVINKNGEKIIWLNFFCSHKAPVSDKNIVMVLDGGNCYFNIKINLTDKTYFELRINGYA